MIKIYLGNVGSGKTSYAVREMYHNPLRRKTYTNIKTTLSNTVEINPTMIFNTETDGKKSKVTLNKQYWMDIKEPINVILDEAHAIMNSRRSMSKVNMVITDWLALIRRVLGENSSGYGELTFITQLWNRLDIIARDMATNITYCVMHYVKKCLKCGARWQENTEMPEEQPVCVRCGGIELLKTHHTIEVWKFSSMDKFVMWKEANRNTFYAHNFVRDISKYFSLYDTLQWDNLFGELY